MAGGSSNILRAVLRELGWSRTRLEAELRRQAALEAQEEGVGEFARSYPSTAPPSLPVRSWNISGT